jgi:hypothetical protein
MSEMSISWGELANLTHITQVEQFGFCSCEEQEHFPYTDCPKNANEQTINDLLKQIDEGDRK